MTTTDPFQAVFEQLKLLLKPYEPFMDVKSDSGTDYYLDTRTVNPKNKLPIFFGAVAIKKNYVSYHLMPVYVYPELLGNVSSHLKKRMQGKSCFNFKSIDDMLLKELQQLTERGFERYRENGLLGP
jgi:hypothetical protein